MIKAFRKLKYAIIRLLRLKNAARQIALGLVLGFFPCWFPTFGLGAFLSVMLAKLVRGNILAALLSAAVGSILWPLLFYLNYAVGEKLMRRFDETIEPSPVSFESPSDFFDLDFAEEMVEIDYVEPIEQINSWSDIGIQFAVGAAANSILFSFAGYFIFRFSLNRFRKPLLSLMRRNKGRR